MSNELSHAADRLLASVDRCAAPVCVGLDPVVQRLPDSLKPADDNPAAAVQAISDFSRGVLAAVVDHVPCVKLQSACFERYGWRGVQALESIISEASSLGVQVILDAKRGDIGISAEHYASAAFDQASCSDWLTINAFLGEDGIEPFLRPGHGAFALVRTSNPGGDAIQRQVLADGGTVADAVARMISAIGDKTIGKRGFSSLGAVVGATKPEDAAQLRTLMPRQLFLVPGYGAQGGSVQDILPCFSKGFGAIVTASRSVIYAGEKQGGDWQQAVGAAAAAFADEVGRAVGLR